MAGKKLKGTVSYTYHVPGKLLFITIISSEGEFRALADIIQGTPTLFGEVEFEVDDKSIVTKVQVLGASGLRDFLLDKNLSIRGRDKIFQLRSVDVINLLKKYNINGSKDDIDKGLRNRGYHYIGNTSKDPTSGPFYFLYRKPDVVRNSIPTRNRNSGV